MPILLRQRRSALDRRISQQLDVYGLTPRELSIVHLLVQGCSNKEIAGRCDIAVQTVKDHLKHIYGKTGVHQRTALLAFLWGTADDVNANGLPPGTVEACSLPEVSLQHRTPKLVRSA